jgi:hypothetical protein
MTRSLCSTWELEFCKLHVIRQVLNALDALFGLSCNQLRPSCFQASTIYCGSKYLAIISCADRWSLLLHIEIRNLLVGSGGGAWWGSTL